VAERSIATALNPVDF